MTRQTNFDAEFCGRVPLHQTNLIQPHGVLLVLDKKGDNVLQASENAEQVFGVPAREMIAKSFAGFISAQDNEGLQRLLSANSSDRLPFVLQVNGHSYTGTAQAKEDFFILEILIAAAKDPQSFASVYKDVKCVMAAIESAHTTGETCEIAARELKKLSGFDKVMIYRFDEAWNGDVIAEAAEEGLDSYLGLKFPASDIPKQARELYKKTAYRLIPNVDYEPVKLYPVLNPQTNAFTDLSDSNLRSVAAVHLEYLRNMQVTASMSTRILKDGELWGLIACHHRTPAYLSYEMCSVFELLSAVITTKIDAVQAKDLLAYQAKKQEQMTRLVQDIYERKEAKQTLCSLLQADGVAVVLNNRIETEGTTPLPNEINDLVVWLGSQEHNALLHQPNLGAVYEPAEAYAEKDSGLLALPVAGSEGNFILAFRREAVQNVAWGGNPSEAVRFESDGKKYHPRASFRQWQQVLRNTSIPWKKEVLQTAGEVKALLSASRHLSH
jgi:chemotaxis family two-component system sensor kinase Cph1